MNAKLAKELRRVAKSMASSMNNGVYRDRHLVENEHHRKYVHSHKTNADGTLALDAENKPVINSRLIAYGTFVNNEMTFRGTYRKLKKDFRANA